MKFNTRSDTKGNPEVIATPSHEEGMFIVTDEHGAIRAATELKLYAPLREIIASVVEDPDVAADSIIEHDPKDPSIIRALGDLMLTYTTQDREGPWATQEVREFAPYSVPEVYSQ